MRALLSWIRWLPFTVLAILSIWAAGRAPRGRKPFELDMALSAETLARAITKIPHLKYSAMFVLLALLGAGLRRWPTAWLLAVLVGLSWELAEATVVGH